MIPTDSPIQQLLAAPITYTTITFCVLWWFYCWNYDFPLSRVSYSYKRFVQDKEYWRAFSASYSHGSIMHVGFNMMALSSFSYVEAALGMVVYAKFTLILLLGSILLISAISHLLLHRLDMPSYREQESVGYSCVVFGWMAIISANHPWASSSFFGFVQVPAVLSPFLALVFTQIIVPRASLLGHSCGIILGFAIGFGLFAWMTNYLFFCLLFWVILGLFWSLRFHSPISVPCISEGEETSSSPSRRYQIVDGVLTNTNSRNIV